MTERPTFIYESTTRPSVWQLLPLPRFVHRAFAFTFGFFWIPCPNCGRMFGGHERLGGTYRENGRSWVMCRHCPDDMTEGVSDHARAYGVTTPNTGKVTRIG